jgi:hypothetical protein
MIILPFEILCRHLATNSRFGVLQKPYGAGLAIKPEHVISAEIAVFAPNWVPCIDRENGINYFSRERWSGG